MTQNMPENTPQSTPENTNQSTTENMPPNPNRKKIPVSVIAIACLYLVVGVGGFVLHFKELRAPDGVWVEVTESLAIVCGVFLLRAQNWARWLAVAWMVFHVAISFPVFREIAAHSLFLILIVWCLFCADASHYFRNAHAA
ncbi:MAG TPA: hypothetical protein VIY69_03210 [Candidatus Acidoferrales bacterium]